MKIFAAALLATCALATKLSSKSFAQSADPEENPDFFPTGDCADAYMRLDICEYDPHDLDANNDGWIQKKEIKGAFDQCMSKNFIAQFPHGVGVVDWENKCLEHEEYSPMGGCADEYADWDACDFDPNVIDTNGDGWIDHREMA